MAREVIDMTGQTFGRLTVLGRDSSKTNASGVIFWRWRCQCGKHGSCAGTTLRDGNTRSCGCLRLELTKARSKARAAKTAAAVKAAKEKDKAERQAFEAFYAPKQWKDIEQAARALEAAWGGVQR